MAKLRRPWAIGLGCCSALVDAQIAGADAVPAAACRQPKTEGRARIIACLKEPN
jgi:hypothetical protein